MSVLLMCRGSSGGEYAQEERQVRLVFKNCKGWTRLGWCTWRWASTCEAPLWRTRQCLHMRDVWLKPPSVNIECAKRQSDSQIQSKPHSGCAATEDHQTSLPHSLHHAWDGRSHKKLPLPIHHTYAVLALLLVPLHTVASAGHLRPPKTASASKQGGAGKLRMCTRAQMSMPAHENRLW